MSSEPLPLPEVWSDRPEGDPARVAFVANDRSSLVLIEYASDTAQQADPQAFVPARATQAAAPDRLSGLALAALLQGLAELATTIGAAEALLRVQGVLKSDVHYAVEHIHDVAMALRMRDVEQALCDTLDASVRQVGDAIVRHEAAATGAASAAGLLRDVMRRIEDLVTVASHGTAGSTDETAPAASAGGFAAAMADVDGVAAEAMVADTAGAEASADTATGSVPQVQAVAAAENDVAASAAIGVDEIVLSQQQTFIAPEANTYETEAVGQSSTADSAAAAARADREAPLGGATNSAVATNPNQAANDPLAVLHGLSEEELIALFS
jgi:hypothetical protein